MKKGVLKKTQSFFRQNPLAEHAMEFVAEINGVVYVNDSISITIDKTRSSIDSIGGNVILIMGEWIRKQISGR